MGKVVSIETARDARVSQERAWEIAVEKLLGAAGVWPEEIDSLVNGLRSRLPVGTTTVEASKFVLQQMGWHAAGDNVDE